ncbi:MAG TPA: DUF6544 family protein, partial [Burkholderiaceae bacterium]
DLPLPIARHLARALAHAGEPPFAVRLAHRGEFDVSPRRVAWRAFTSRQWMLGSRPGFVWAARMSMLPAVAVDVLDAYVDGVAELRADLWGWLPLSKARATPAIARGELMRWLAESVLVPWAWRTCPGLRWRPVDDRHADATLADGAVDVALHFAFGADGLAESVHADSRPRMVGGGIVETPWNGRWSDYRTCDGVLVPTRGEVEWRIDGRRKPYLRAALARYEGVQRAGELHA